jgi:O-antigen/teichoic acid export membrane protein
MPLVAGLGVLAGTSYVTLVLAGRLLGAATFAGISVLYVLVSSFATGMFLPVEQEIARRRGHERGSATFDPSLVRRAVMVSLVAAIAICLLAIAARPVPLRLLGGNWNLLGALCVALPGYACCFVSRGVFAGCNSVWRGASGWLACCAWWSPVYTASPRSAGSLPRRRGSRSPRH